MRDKILSKANLFYLLSALVYAALRIVHAYALRHSIHTDPDSNDYLCTALPLLSREFWAGSRPFTVPLLYKLAGVSRGHLVRAVALQCAVSTLSWLFLAWQAARSLKSGLLRPLAFALVLVFGLTNGVLVWDLAILSESLSVAFLALMLGGWLWLLRGWSWGKCAFVLAASLLWAFARDANAFLILPVAALCVLFAAFRKSERRLLAVAAGLLAIVAFSQWSIQDSERWVSVGLDMVAVRVLPDPDNTRAFQKLGLPVSDYLVRSSRLWLLAPSTQMFDQDPKLEEFRDWFYAHWKSAYLRWLLTRPKSYLEPFDRTNFNFDSYSDDWCGADYRPVLPSAIEKMIYPIGAAVPVSWVVILLAAAAVALRLWESNPAVWVPLAMVLLLYPHAFIVQHGDAGDTGRHGLQLSMQLFLSGGFLALLLADRFLSPASARKKSGSAAGWTSSHLVS